jgi:hypothetical protein
MRRRLATLLAAAAALGLADAHVSGVVSLRARAGRASRIDASATTACARFTNLLPASAAAPALTTVQRARTIGAGQPSGVMSTLQGGLPFAAPVDYVLNERGEPVFMLKAGSTTHANSLASAAGSLLVVDSLTAQSVTLIGSICPLPEQEFAQSHVDFLNLHPVARECLATGGLGFYKMTVDKCYIAPVGTTAPDGVWLPIEEYARASIDAIAPFAVAIMASVNGPKRADLRRFCDAFWGAPFAKCEMVGLDQLGFDVEVVAAAEGSTAVRRRIGFSEPRVTEQEVRSLFVKTFFQAWDPAMARGSE